MSIEITVLVIIAFLGGVTVGVLLSNFKEPDGVINMMWQDGKCIWDIKMDEEKIEPGSVLRFKFAEEKEDEKD